MSKNLYPIKNPLESLGFAHTDIIGPGEFGAVLARTGIGKTPVVVQMAIHAMNQEKKVIHLSLEEPVKKVNLWYHEVFQHMAEKNNIEAPSSAWDVLLPNRFIITLQQDRFTIPRLEERLLDLSEQNIFIPEILIIDGFPFNETDVSIIDELKTFTKNHNLRVWFTIRTHRHEPPDAKGLPQQLSGIDHYFESALQIIPENDQVTLKPLIGSPCPDTCLQLDPNTLLVTE